MMDSSQLLREMMLQLRVHINYNLIAAPDDSSLRLLIVIDDFIQSAGQFS